MGGAMTIRRLIIDSGDGSVGNSKSVGCSEALDDSPELEILTLLANEHCNELSGRELVIVGVVGGRLISYLRWEVGEDGPVASKGGILGASATWDGESVGTWAEEALCLRGTCRWRSEKGSSSPHHAGNESWALGLCFEGVWSASLWKEMRAGLEIEWRWVISQGGRGE